MKMLILAIKHEIKEISIDVCLSIFLKINFYKFIYISCFYD